MTVMEILNDPTYVPWLSDVTSDGLITDENGTFIIFSTTLLVRNSSDIHGKKRHWLQVKC